jgi:hypothetical protein
MTTYRSIAGEAMPGRTFLGDTTGGLTVQLSEHGFINLTVALMQTLKFYEAEFPDIRRQIGQAPATNS